MGAFTEMVLSFDFRPGTPDRVMAAFSALAATVEAPPGATPLPRPVVETWRLWEPGWDENREPGEPEGDPAADSPWLHDWARWLGTATGVRITPHARLVWAESGRWNLGCRCSFRCGPEAVGRSLAWLAPFVETWDDDVPLMVGYARFEYAPRPHLFWVSGGLWEIEDLNTDDDWR